MISVTIKNSYGHRRVYPVCEGALALARIAGTKTLSEYVLYDAQRLGIEVQATGTPEDVADLHRFMARSKEAV